MRKYVRLIPYAVLIAAFAAIALCLLVFENDFLWRVQELNLFSNTPDFFREQMVVPGGFLSWGSTFFTQFFYHPWMGVAWLCVWWALLSFLIIKTFKIPERWLLVLLIPVGLLLISNMQIGYWVYIMKLRGYFFVTTIGLTLAIVLIWIYRILPVRFFIRTAFMIVAAFVSYPLMGCYGLFAILLMVLLCWKLIGLSASSKIIDTLVGILCIIAVPLVYYRYVYYQTNIDEIYMAALPVFCYDDWYLSFYLPFVGLAVFYVLAALAYKRRAYDGVVKHLPLWIIAQCCLVALMVWLTHNFWYKDFNFHKEMSMLRCVDRCDWNGVVAEATVQEDEPTRSILMLRNLALSRLGRQGDEMYQYPSGAKSPGMKVHIRMTQISGKAIYFNYGQLNYCYRWCLEEGVENGWRVEYLKYLTRCAMLNGEKKVALKYINILKTTLFHRQWAEEHERLLYNPEAMNADPEFEPVTHFLSINDKLTSDNGLAEIFLNHQLMDVPIDTDDPILQEQSLLAAIWMKDISVFWPRFARYMQLHPGKHIPTHYQEVALLYGNLEHQVDISKIPFDETVLRVYQNFNARVQQNAGMTEEILKDRLRPEFGNTFYYEYFLNRDQQIY